MGIETFQPDSDLASVLASFRREGAVVIEGLASTALCDSVAAEFRPHLDAEGRNTESDFNGYRTLRISGILAKSPNAAELIGHSRVLELADELLLPHCINYRIGSCTGIEILPGEDAQVLHRDDTIYPVRLPGMELQMSVMWALCDFTLANGATHVVPRSHRRHEPRPPTAEESVQTPLGKGSALFYTGSTWHGGGANSSDHARMGLVNTYALGWLRQEENHYLMVPREIADRLPEHLRRLMGYQGHGPMLGWYEGNPDGY